MVVETIACE